MMARIIQKNMDRIDYRERTVFWVLFAVFALLLITYGVLVERTITNAVSVENMAKQTVALNSSVNSLESHYLALQNGITIDFALAHGFVTAPENKFAMIAPANRALSVNEN